MTTDLKLMLQLAERCLALAEKATARPWVYGDNQMGHIIFLWPKGRVNDRIGEIYQQTNEAHATADLICTSVSSSPAFWRDLIRRVKRVQNCRYCWPSNDGIVRRPDVGGQWSCLHCGPYREDLIKLAADPDMRCALDAAKEK